jgi:hypothetical protein
MPRVGFETVTPVFERAKTVHALVPEATVIGHKTYKRILKHREVTMEPCGIVGG